MRGYMQAMSLRSKVTYARRTAEVCLASAAGVVASIAGVRAWETLDDTGLSGSSGMVSRLRSSTEDAKSTKEGATCLFTAHDSGLVSDNALAVILQGAGAASSVGTFL